MSKAKSLGEELCQLMKREVEKANARPKQSLGDEISTLLGKPQPQSEPEQTKATAESEPEIDWAERNRIKNEAMDKALESIKECQAIVAKLKPSKIVSSKEWAEFERYRKSVEGDCE